MILTDVDRTHGLLTIRFFGRVDAAQMRQCVERLEGLLSDLEPGFRVLTDLSELESMETACVPYITRSMDLCNRKGVAAIARVIPEPHKDLGYGIMSRFHYDARVRIAVCETLEQATEFLSLQALANVG